MFCSDMTAYTTITPASVRPGDGQTWARPALVRQLEVLGELAEAGLRMALAIERQATEAPPQDEAAPKAPPSLEALARAYARAARAVRMTVLLQSKVIKDLQFLDTQIALDDARVAKTWAMQPPDERLKARVERIVERIAEADRPGDRDAVHRLVVEAGERLDDDDIYGDLLSRPVGEIVARICRDLGLDPDWTRLAEEAWAIDEIASGAPSSPFASLPRPIRAGPEPPNGGFRRRGLEPLPRSRDGPH
jgi:hypothetical protein